MKKIIKTKNKFVKPMVAMTLMLVISFVMGIGYAAFADRGDVKGASITVGSSDIKLLADVGLGADAANLVDELVGPSFEGIGQNWTDDYVLKIFNNAAGPVLLTSSANYLTADDLSDLRGEVDIEIIPWDDSNGDGFVVASELGTSIGKKTIIKWKTEGFDLGQLNSGSIAGFVLRFSVANLSSTKQGAEMLFDFMFDAVGLN